MADELDDMMGNWVKTKKMKTRKRIARIEGLFGWEQEQEKQEWWMAWPSGGVTAPLMG